jgi:hypothetical protein
MTSWRWAAEAACSVKLLDDGKYDYSVDKQPVIMHLSFPSPMRNRASCSNSITANTKSTGALGTAAHPKASDVTA